MQRQSFKTLSNFSLVRNALMQESCLAKLLKTLIVDGIGFDWAYTCERSFLSLNTLLIGTK